MNIAELPGFAGKRGLFFAIMLWPWLVLVLPEEVMAARVRYFSVNNKLKKCTDAFQLRCCRHTSMANNVPRNYYKNWVEYRGGKF